MTSAAHHRIAKRASTASTLWRLLVPVPLLLLAATLISSSSRASSCTFDEPYHLGAGYAFLRTGDARLFSDHPPLVDSWLATPLLLLDLNLPLQSAAWEVGEYGSFGDVWLWQANADRALKAIWAGRLPNLALALFLGSSVYAWTRSRFGLPAAVAALAAYTLDPSMIAHSGLATNDTGVAAAVFIAAWAWWRWLNWPSALRLAAAGILAGAACASKYTGLVVGPVFVTMAALHPSSPGAGQDEWARRARGLVVAGATCLVVVWAAYGFGVEGGLPAAGYWRGLVFQGERFTGGQPVYALGQVWPDGVWFYYPLALALKTPIPTMLLVGIGLGSAIVWRTVRRALTFAVPALVVFAAAQASALQLGHRYLLPALPFVMPLAGLGLIGLRSWWPRHANGKARLGAVALLVAWLLANVFAIHPHELAFFNELAGGSEGADRYLVDANLDWGQGLIDLRAAMKERQISYVHLGYFGSAVPDQYGIEYWPAPGFLRFVNGPESLAFNPYFPDPGWYAVSRTSLRQGLSLTDPDLYAHFRPLPVDARAGYSINLYNVTYPTDRHVSRAVVQGERVGSLPSSVLGVLPGDRLIVKWFGDSDSFVLAMNGAARYLVSDPLSFAPDLRAGFTEHAVSSEDGAWDVDAGAHLSRAIETWRSTSQLWAPGLDLEIEPPVDFDGGLSLVGHRLDVSQLQAGDSVAVTTLWRVSGNVRPPVAMFLHLLADGGEVASQYDGWGTAIRGLEIGDIAVLHATLPLQRELPPGRYRVQVGLYTPDTMVRWRAIGPAGQGMDRLLLPEVRIG